MSIFSWLVVGHLIGDWLLQNDWMAKGKKLGLVTVPGLTHFSIYTVTLLVMLWCSIYERNYSVYYFISAGFFIFFSHWFIDATNIVERWIRFFGQTDIPMVRIMIDQTFHIITLVLVYLLFLRESSI